jgi:hypothetical protein
MTYCFKCDTCGASWEHSSQQLGLHPVNGCGQPRVLRDYRAEAASPQVANLKREREAGGRSAVRDMFLPTAKDYESPSDPDGSKGIRKWADEHAPADGNKRPDYPDMPKKSFAMGG